MHKSANQPANQSVNQSTNQSINHSIIQSTNRIPNPLHLVKMMLQNHLKKFATRTFGLIISLTTLQTITASDPLSLLRFSSRAAVLLYYDIAPLIRCLSKTKYLTYDRRSLEKLALIVYVNITLTFSGAI